MHLLAARAGAIQQEGEAIDLVQTPGRIVFASAADSELTALAASVDRAGVGDLRLANLMRLSHNLSVDLWLEKTVRPARLIVVRLLGGVAYWPYGVDELCRLAEETGALLALLPGEGAPDPALLRRSRLEPTDWQRLHALFSAGGPDNFDRALSALLALCESRPIPDAAPSPFPDAGLWWPGAGLVEKEWIAELHDGTPLPTSPTRGEVRSWPRRTPARRTNGEGVQPARAPAGRPSLPQSPTLLSTGRDGEGGRPAAYIPILFYRAVLEGAGTATLQALIGGLRQAGLAPIPVMVASLKQEGSIRFVREVFARFPPDIVLNLTGFALGLGALAEAENPFAGCDAPVVQLVQSGRPEAQWAADMQGLSAKDLAMQVVLPELDGRIGGLMVGHKEQSLWHEATQCPLAAYAPDADGIAAAVELVGNYVRLRRTPRFERRVAIVLANYPIRDGRLANGVGYDAPQSTVEILKALETAGYRAAPPSSGASRHLLPLGEKEDAAVSRGDLALATGFASPLVGEGPRKGGEGAFPQSGNALIEALQSGPTNAHPARGQSPAQLPLADYKRLFANLPEKIRREVSARWGEAEDDPFVRCTSPLPSSRSGGEVDMWQAQTLTLPLMGRDGEGWGSSRSGAFHLPVLILGNIAVLLQPSRGYHLDAAASYHDPDLVPPHGYLAAYLWMRYVFGAHALVHNGKHGNLEWLPGKAVALDRASYPLALWGGLPHFYPFIVNDPGEGTQAKRRSGATIIDHLVPPLTRAETYGPLKDLEALLDEYYAASGLDRRRLKSLRQRILDCARDAALDRDIGIADDSDAALARIDTFLCDVKEAQIRDGLHILGQSPTGRLERDLIVALVRVPRGEGLGEASLIRALSDDLKLGFDPLTANLGTKWMGPNPSSGSALPSHLRPQGKKEGASGAASPSPLVGVGAQRADEGAWRTHGDVVEFLENLAAELVDGAPCPEDWHATRAVFATVETTIRPRLAASGPNEIKALLDGLDGKFVAPGPSGAPSRGRIDVLPTGRNFYSVDNRAVPTPTAWELGQKSAEALVARHFEDHGTWLRSAVLSVWGTANMRTGGDDIAQALALVGARPRWDPGSLRVSGYEIIPLARLGRPRVDVTLKISGFFRDAFPQMIALYDRAIRAIGALDEPEAQNPIAARMRAEALGLMAAGHDEGAAFLKAGHRIFGSKPGAYGAGLQGPIDSGNWTDASDLAAIFVDWGQYAYGAAVAGAPERERFAARLSDVEAVLHNQDNREHDLLDSDDYYQFEGGLAVATTVLSGRRPAIYHSDHSRPEHPVTRTLEEEVSRVMRSRVVNPKWIDGVRRHGYKGAFEIIATLDYMFAFAATTGAVKTHHFDLAFEAFVLDEPTRAFIEDNNRHGYDELLAKFREARQRGFWTPRSNSVHAFLDGEPR